MVGAGKTLTVADVIEINRRMISHFGGIFFEGDDNLANRGSLEYVLAEIHGSLYGEGTLPRLFPKSRLNRLEDYCWAYFPRGNKRTAMESCRLFLELHGYKVKMDMEIVDIALRIANHDIEFDVFIAWQKKRATAV